jgi:hypothetical protein
MYFNKKFLLAKKTTYASSLFVLGDTVVKGLNCSVPDPYPYVLGLLDPDPDPSFNKQKH